MWSKAEAKPQVQEVSAFSVDVLQTADGFKMLDIVEGFNNAAIIGFSMLGRTPYKAYLNYFSEKFEHIFYFTLFTDEIHNGNFNGFFTNHPKFTLVNNFSDIPRILNDSAKNLANCLIIVDHRIAHSQFEKLEQASSRGSQLSPFAVKQYLVNMGLDEIPVLSSSEFFTGTNNRQVVANFCEGTPYFPKSIFLKLETVNLSDLQLPDAKQYIIKLIFANARVKPCKINSQLDVIQVLTALKTKDHSELAKVKSDINGKKDLEDLFKFYCENYDVTVIVQEFVEAQPTIISGKAYASKIRLACVAIAEGDRISIKIVDGYRMPAVKPIIDKDTLSAITTYKLSAYELPPAEVQNLVSFEDRKRIAMEVMATLSNPNKPHNKMILHIWLN